MEYIALLTSFTASSVLAFEPRLEPLSHTCCCNRNSRRHASRLYASEYEQSNNNFKNDSPRSKTSGFDFVSAPFAGLEDISLLFDRGVFDGTFPMLQEQADALALETFEEKESFEFDDWDNCGEDCKECEIPKAWCVPGEKTINVMEYLGVTRVKPLC